MKGILVLSRSLILSCRILCSRAAFGSWIYEIGHSAALIYVMHKISFGCRILFLHLTFLRIFIFLIVDLHRLSEQIAALSPLYQFTVGLSLKSFIFII